MLKALFLSALTSIALRAEFNPANLDRAVRPQDNFYLHADGGWIRRARIPADQSRWSKFDQLTERNLNTLRVLCERATAQSDVTTPGEQKVSDFYASGMDSAQSNALAATPLQFEFERIDELRTPADVLAELAHVNGLGVDAGFAFGTSPDLHDSNAELPEVRQGGLGLPERGYYLRTDAKSRQLLQQYRGHVDHMLQLLGETAAVAQARAGAVLQIETALAAGSLDPVELRDPAASYHKVTLAEAEALFPGIGWKAYFSRTEAPAFSTLNLAHPKFLGAFSDALARFPVADWRAYLRWHFINAYAPYLSDDFVQADFRFYGATLTGAKALEPRWKRVVASIDRGIGDALGRLFAENTLRPEDRARVLRLVAEVRAALRARLETLDWMDAPTRARALAKIDALAVQVGYPDRWRDYHSLIIDRGPWVLNVLKANAFEARRQLAKIGQPVDRLEWSRTVPTVNASYRIESNAIFLYAGILQPPFFDPKADDAVNYGAIGQVIGHEMTHGFDDQGSRFDAAGNLANWWTPESARLFKARAAAIVRQFNGYEAQPGLHLNGELTQGENIADLGGLKIAYAALERSLGGGPRERLDGCTPEQRFFLSFASIYASLYRPERMILQVRTNPHSPGEFRVNGPLSNLDEFAAAFGVPEGSPMRRPAVDRVNLW